MSRFVILVHDHPFLHWDLLLENGEACLTWRLLADPAETSDEIAAEKRTDHRLMYLDYEGLVRGGRGTVTRWDYGTFEWIRNRDDACEVRVTGQRWRGIIQIERVAEDTWRVNRSLDR